MAKFRRMVFIILCACMAASVTTGCRTTPKHDSAGEFVDDSVITTRVKAAIFDEMALKTFQINVTTFQGVVQLSGFVDSADNAKRAGEIARGVKGVKEVRNDLIAK